MKKTIQIVLVAITTYLLASCNSEQGSVSSKVQQAKPQSRAQR